MESYPFYIRVIIFIMIVVALVKLSWFVRFLYRWRKTGDPERLGSDDDNNDAHGV